MERPDPSFIGHQFLLNRLIYERQTLAMLLLYRGSRANASQKRKESIECGVLSFLTPEQNFVKIRARMRRKGDSTIQRSRADD